MRSMEKQALINELKEYLTAEDAVRQTLACLSEKAEVEIVVGGTVHLSVHGGSTGVMVEEKAATAPDFIFKASPEAIKTLIAENELSPAQLGIKLSKQIISRDIQVAMPSSIFQITRKGYLKIVKLGGTEFLTELKKHNLTSLSSIISALKKLKNN